MASADPRGAASAAISLRWVYPKHLKEPLKLAMAYKLFKRVKSINKVIFTKS